MNKGACGVVMMVVLGCGGGTPPAEVPAEAPEEVAEPIATSVPLESLDTLEEARFTIGDATWRVMTSGNRYDEAGPLFACVDDCRAERCAALPDDEHEPCAEDCSLTCDETFDALRPTSVLVRDRDGLIEPHHEVRYDQICVEESVATAQRVPGTDVVKLTLGCSQGEDARSYEGQAWYLRVGDGVEAIFRGPETALAEYHGCTAFDDVRARLSEDGATLIIDRVTEAWKTSPGEPDASCDEAAPEAVVESTEIPLD